MNNYSTYALGFLCGLIAVILVTLLLRFIFRKKAAFSGNQYDERQRAVQGVGYKYGFLALLVTLLAGAVAEQLLGRSVMSLITFAILCMWVGLCAYIGYCIRFDAYIALNAKRKPLLIVFLAVITPSASTITQMCQVYGNDSQYASAINVMTTLFSIVTMPLMVLLFQMIL